MEDLNSNIDTERNSGLKDIIKAAYSIQSYFFLSINIFCFIIVFFVLDDANGGFILRAITFLAALAIGGFFGLRYSRKRPGGRLYWFKFGAGCLLLIFTLLAWGNNGKGRKYTFESCYDNQGSYNDGYTHGRIISHAYDAETTSCDDYVNQMRNEGVSLEVSQCFCQGYNDGKSGRSNKYK